MLRTLGIGFSALALLTGATGATFGDGAPPDNLSQPSRDATAYAKMVGVTVNEADRRIALQAAIGDLGATLELREAATFGGLYIEHKPTFRAVAQFTTDEAATLRRYVSGTSLDGLVEPQHVTRTWLELKSELNAIRAQLGIGSYALDVDTRENRVEIEVTSSSVFHRLQVDRNFEVPSSAVVIVIDSLPEPVLDLYGGLSLTSCTSGFTIYKGSNPANRAITTAGHCSNSQSYGGNALTYQNDEVVSGSYDSQSHKQSGATYRNWAFDGLAPFPYYRTITSVTLRSSQAVGQFVCHYGMTTLYGCGYIVSKTATPCGGGAFPQSTAIKVDSDPDGTGFDLSQSGDSGGPWFIGNSALGTMSCQQGFDAIYVTVDYVQAGLLAHILTQP